MTVHVDYPDDAYWAQGVVSRDRTRAIFTFVALDTSAAAQPGRVRLPGLDPQLAYRVEPVPLSDGALVRTRSGKPSWWLERPVVSGRALEAIGLQGPMLYPEQALVFRLTAEQPTQNRS
jgi:alpha-galactosidase